MRTGPCAKPPGSPAGTAIVAPGRAQGEGEPRLLDLVREHRNEVQAAVERHPGLTFAVFGSAARGEDSAARDIDILVPSNDFGKGAPFLCLGRVHLVPGSVKGERPIAMVWELERPMPAATCEMAAAAAI